MAQVQTDPILTYVELQTTRCPRLDVRRVTTCRLGSDYVAFFGESHVRDRVRCRESRWPHESQETPPPEALPPCASDSGWARVHAMLSDSSFQQLALRLIYGLVCGAAASSHDGRVVSTPTSLCRTRWKSCVCASSQEHAGQVPRGE